MASTSSDSLQEELRSLHRRLITDIASTIDSESGEGQIFLFHIEDILGAGIYRRHKSLPYRIKALEKKKVFGLENYEGLKKICKDSGNLNLIDIIENCEGNMKEIRSKYKENGSSESTKEEGKGIKRKLSEKKEEIKRIGVKDSDEQKQQEYEKAKSELQNKVIQEYQKNVPKVPAMPLMLEEKCEFIEIYVRPKIVREVKAKKGTTKETEIKSMSEIFTKNDVLLKSVYVVGDEGTGKSKSSESTKEECEGIESKPSNIEMRLSEQKKEIIRVRGEDSDEQIQLAYEMAKSELRNKMIQEYQTTVLKVPAMPLMPEETCEFIEIYVRPKIVSEVKAEKGTTKKTEIKSMSEIFTKNDVPQKSIYVVGDAGTGKSSFCKYLVDSWCKAHSAGHIVEDEFGGVNEMKKFEFLFLISLRCNQNKDSIYDMLKNQYDIDILDTLLKKESAKLIVLLDGLDEWSPEGKTQSQFQTKGLPKKDFLKDYTIVTTSRPWKFHTLRIRDTEIQQMLKLKGFDDDSESEMIKRTVLILNSKKGESKNIDRCRKKLKEKSLRGLKEVPIMLQQLICLWFDCKLDKTSRCVVYTEMLELFFTWNEDNTANTSSGNADGSQTIELPAYFADKEMCELNSHLIYDMSRLAYETLFNCSKDKSLTFDISLCTKLKITDDVRIGCLNLGILREERYPSLLVTERPKPMFSFIHKTVQEFLAAVNITITFKTKMSSSHNFENIDLQSESIQFVEDVFSKCSTVNKILEQSNVIIMLCGLEPRLATHVSKYIYDIVKKDSLVQRYRRSIDIRNSYHSCERDIQNLIFDSMKECYTCPVVNIPSFFIGDLCIYAKSEYDLTIGDDEYDKNCDIVCSSFDQQQITPDFIHSIDVDNIINSKNVQFSKYLPKFKHLEKIEINYDILELSSTENVELRVDEVRIDEVNKSVLDTIKKNISTLKSLSLGRSLFAQSYYNLNPLCQKVVCILPSMNNLVAIKITDVIMSHVDTNRLCVFLERTSHLEQIYIYIECECENQHDVDLSKLQQLQYLNLNDRTCIFVTDIDTVNLEILICWQIKSTNYIKIFESMRKSDKLKNLELFVSYDNKSQSFHTSLTERLVSVLPFLHSLSQLNLRQLRLTDNIIQVPSKMKSLKLIDLCNVIMSLTTWRKFVDNLPKIPHTVEVMLSNCYITGDGKELNVDMISLLRGGGKINEATQYVKNRKHFFIVKNDDFLFFSFSTKR